MLGAKINDQDEVGRSALMEACIAFKRDTIHLLLERNADVNLFDNNGVTALMRAALWRISKFSGKIIGIWRR